MDERMNAWVSTCSQPTPTTGGGLEHKQALYTVINARMDAVTRMLGDTGPEPFTMCGDGARTQQLAWALHSRSPWDKGPAWQREVGAKAGDWGTQSISAWPQEKTQPGKGGREAEELDG